MRSTLGAAALVLVTACGGPARAPVAPSPIPPSPVPPTRQVTLYNVTFSADPAACGDLPAALRVRTYSAIDGTRFGAKTLTLQGSTFFESSDATFNVLIGHMSDSFASLNFEEAGSVADMITPNSYLWIYGGAEGPIGSGPQSQLPMWAHFTFCEAPKAGTRYPECSVPPIKCSSNRYTLTLERP